MHATCNLVVVDRVPNPVDDARVPALVARLGCDRWVADGLVYVADAALLLKQATGWLVRREPGSGLLAVLDPRLRRGPWGYRGKAAPAYARR
jgi:Rad3-related DNA helicase